MQNNIRLYLMLCVSFILVFSACSQKTHDLEAALASLNTDELAADADDLTFIAPLVSRLAGLFLFSELKVSKRNDITSPILSSAMLAPL